MKKSLYFSNKLRSYNYFAAAYGVLQIEKLGFSSFREIPFNQLLSYGMQALGLLSIGFNRGWNKRGRKEGNQQMEDYIDLLLIEEVDKQLEEWGFKEKTEKEGKSK